MFGRRKKVADEFGDTGSGEVVTDNGVEALDELPQATSTAKGLVPVMACGAGLFSDGYINNVRMGPFPTPRLNHRLTALILIIAAI